MKKIFSCKKGNIFVVGILFLILILVLGIWNITVDPHIKEVYDKADDYLKYNSSKEIVTDSRADYSNFWDGAFLFVFGAFWIAMLILGYQDNYGKFIMIIMMLMMIGLAFVAGALTDYWVDASDNPDRATEVDYPYTFLILDNFLLVFILLIGTAFFVYFTGDYIK